MRRVDIEMGRSGCSPMAEAIQMNPTQHLVCFSEDKQQKVQFLGGRAGSVSALNAKQIPRLGGHGAKRCTQVEGLGEAMSQQKRRVRRPSLKGSKNLCDHILLPGGWGGCLGGSCRWEDCPSAVP